MSFDVEKWMADNYGLLGVYDIANTIRAAAGACENVRDQEMRDLAEFKNREIVKLIAERDEARAQLAIASRDKEQGAVQHVKGAWNDRCMCDPCVLVRDIVNAQVAAAFSVAADYIDECNIKGPYQAIGAAPALRALTPADAARELERKVLEAYYRGREMGHASKGKVILEKIK